MKAPHSKCGIRATVSGVQIPPSPPTCFTLNTFAEQRGVHLHALKDVWFDAEDQGLFYEADLALKARAIRDSVRPRLTLLLQAAVQEVMRVYKVDPMDDSIISAYPAFRSARSTTRFVDYDNAFAGLGGKRQKDVWQGVARADGKPAQIVPFRFGFRLTAEGLALDAHHHWLKGLDGPSLRKYGRFYANHADSVQKLLFLTSARPAFAFYPNAVPTASLGKMYGAMLSHANPYFDFVSSTLNYPFRFKEADEMVARFISVFPIYGSLVQISKGLRPRFRRLLRQTDAYWENRILDKQKVRETSDNRAFRRASDADHRVVVAKGLRWRVFARDGFCCVVCGARGSERHVLHADHIIPRSKGGSDDLSNRQTICSACNLGKGNRDDTDFRRA